MVTATNTKEFMPAVAPITQRDVARACGVHPSTICLALGNSPSIPLPTRERVQAMARKLGYRPNAAARNLAFLRGDKSETVALPLAWLNQEPERGFWKTHPVARRYFEGAQRRAGEHGYYLEEFWVHEPGMRLVRLAQIIRARGVQGVVFPCFDAFSPALFDPLWSDFSVMAFNDHRAESWTDVVCADHYHNVDLALRHLRQGGFRRVGLLVSEHYDATTDGFASCRYLRHQGELPPADRMGACVLAGDRAERLAQLRTWYRDHRPDAILCGDPELPEFVQAAGLDVAVARLQGTANDLTGVDDRPAEVAAMAVDCLADKIRRFERGLGGPTRRYLIKGAWREGAAFERRLAAVA